MFFCYLSKPLITAKRMGFFATTFLLTTFFACEPAAPKVEERIERFETGAISRRVELVNGQREGKMTDFYPDGKLMAERWFNLGKQHGKTLIYYPAGAVKEVQYYAHGEQQGGDTIWYEDGRIQFAVVFEKSKKNGYLRKWSPIGDLIFESKFAMDTLIEVKGEAINRTDINARYAADTIVKPKRQ